MRGSWLAGGLVLAVLVGPSLREINTAFADGRVPALPGWAAAAALVALAGLVVYRAARRLLRRRG